MSVTTTHSNQYAVPDLLARAYDFTYRVFSGLPHDADDDIGSFSLDSELGQVSFDLERIAPPMHSGFKKAIENIRLAYGHGVLEDDLFPSFVAEFVPGDFWQAYKQQHERYFNEGCVVEFSFDFEKLTDGQKRLVRGSGGTYTKSPLLEQIQKIKGTEAYLEGQYYDLLEVLSHGSKPADQVEKIKSLMPLIDKDDLDFWQGIEDIVKTDVSAEEKLRNMWSQLGAKDTTTLRIVARSVSEKHALETFVSSLPSAIKNKENLTPASVANALKERVALYKLFAAGASKRSSLGNKQVLAHAVHVLSEEKHQSLAQYLYENPKDVFASFSLLGAEVKPVKDADGEYTIQVLRPVYKKQKLDKSIEKVEAIVDLFNKRLQRDPRARLSASDVKKVIMDQFVPVTQAEPEDSVMFMPEPALKSAYDKLNMVAHEYGGFVDYSGSSIRYETSYPEQKDLMAKALLQIQLAYTNRKLDDDFVSQSALALAVDMHEVNLSNHSVSFSLKESESTAIQGVHSKVFQVFASGLRKRYPQVSMKIEDGGLLVRQGMGAVSRDIIPNLYREYISLVRVAHQEQEEGVSLEDMQKISSELFLNAQDVPAYHNKMVYDDQVGKYTYEYQGKKSVSRIKDLRACMANLEKSFPIRIDMRSASKGEFILHSGLKTLPKILKDDKAFKERVSAQAKRQLEGVSTYLSTFQERLAEMDKMDGSNPQKHGIQHLFGEYVLACSPRLKSVSYAKDFERLRPRHDGQGDRVIGHRVLTLEASKSLSSLCADERNISDISSGLSAYYTHLKVVDSGGDKKIQIFLPMFASPNAQIDTRLEMLVRETLDDVANKVSKSDDLSDDVKHSLCEITRNEMRYNVQASNAQLLLKSNESVLQSNEKQDVSRLSDVTDDAYISDEALFNVMHSYLLAYDSDRHMSQELMPEDVATAFKLSYNNAQIVKALNVRIKGLVDDQRYGRVIAMSEKGRLRLAQSFFGEIDCYAYQRREGGFAVVPKGWDKTIYGARPEHVVGEREKQAFGLVDGQKIMAKVIFETKASIHAKPFVQLMALPQPNIKAFDRKAPKGRRDGKVYDKNGILVLNSDQTEMVTMLAEYWNPDRPLTREQLVVAKEVLGVERVLEEIDKAGGVHLKEYDKFMDTSARQNLEEEASRQHLKSPIERNRDRQALERRFEKFLNICDESLERRVKLYGEQKRIEWKAAQREKLEAERRASAASDDIGSHAGVSSNGGDEQSLDGSSVHNSSVPQPKKISQRELLSRGGVVFPEPSNDVKPVYDQYAKPQPAVDGEPVREDIPPEKPIKLEDIKPKAPVLEEEERISSIDQYKEVLQAEFSKKADGVNLTFEHNGEKLIIGVASKYRGALMGSFAAVNSRNSDELELSVSFEFQ